MHNNKIDNLQQDIQTAIDILDGEYSESELCSLLSTYSKLPMAQPLIHKCIKARKEMNRNEERMD